MLYQKKILNLNAAQAARRTSAFDTARQYLELILDIVPETFKIEFSCEISVK